MSKRLPGLSASAPYRPPVRLRLPQISLQELKTIRVAIRRKDVPPDAVASPLIRKLENPAELILHKPGEGMKPIFDREDIIVNLDFEERVVLTTPELPVTSPASKSEERQTTHPKSRRSRSHSRNRSPGRKYYGRSRSRSHDGARHRASSLSKEDFRNKASTSFYRDEQGRTSKDDNYDSKAESSSVVKSKRRSLSKERRRSLSREREHSKYHKSPPRQDSYRSSRYESERRTRRTPSPQKHDYKYRKYSSRSPTHKRESSRRSRSPYRDHDSKYREYRKRSRSPYTRERYKSPPRKDRREYSRSPPRYRRPPDPERRPNPVPYQIPPHFAGPWPVYEPVPPYVRFVIPEGFVPAAPRFPNIPMRPRPPRPLPVYNSRVIPKIKDPEGSGANTTVSQSTIANSELKSDVSNKTQIEKCE